MFVEGSGEVHVEELLVIDGKGHHPASKTEVAEMVGVNIRVTVGLECGTWEGGREGGRREGGRREEEGGRREGEGRKEGGRREEGGREGEGRERGRDKRRKAEIVTTVILQLTDCMYTISRLCKEGIVWVEDFTGKIVEPLTTNARSLWETEEKRGYRHFHRHYHIWCAHHSCFS